MVNEPDDKDEQERAWEAEQEHLASESAKAEADAMAQEEMVNNKPVPQGDDEGLLTDIDIPQVFPQKRCISQAYANGWNDCRNTVNKKIKAQHDLTRQERLDRPELILEIDSVLRKISWFQDKWLSFDKKDRHFIIKQLLALILDEEEIMEKVKAIQNPYTAEFFPRDDKWAGQILREKGLTDDEIGGVSGALGRVAFEYIMAEIDRLLEP